MRTLGLVLATFLIGALFSLAPMALLQQMTGWVPNNRWTFAILFGAVMATITAFQELIRLKREADARALAKRLSLWHSAREARRSPGD